MSTGGRIASQWAGSFVDLLFPPQCVWCQRPTRIGQRLCHSCRQRFLNDYYRCQKCAAPLPKVLPNNDCVLCRAGKWRFSTVVTLATYRGDMRRAVIMMKRKRFEPLRRAMADLLGEKLQQQWWPTHRLNSSSGVEESSNADGSHAAATPAVANSPVLVPVPYHWSHGFSSAADTAELLAHGIATQTTWPVVQGAVRRVRKTAKQGVLTWAERKANVHKAFALKSAQEIRGRQVLLVDDVFTSGATAAELTRILLRGGAAGVSIAVVARATGVRESPGME